MRCLIRRAAGAAGAVVALVGPAGVLGPVRTLLRRAALSLTASLALAARGLAALAVTGAAASALAAVAPSCSGGTCTVTYTTPGTGQSFTVPSGVSSVSVTLYGGKGGTSKKLFLNDSDARDVEG